jgi:transposase InsO family protein
MPWQEVSAMEQRRELVRLGKQDGANRRELCRRFGVSAQTGYKWLARSAAGDEALADRSRRPLNSPWRTAAQREAQVLAVRDAHPAWGARKIVHSLARQGIEPPAASTVHEILRRHGRIEAAAGACGGASQRFEMMAPNLLWQMDFKGWVALANGSRCHGLTMVDDHSRYLLCLRACADERATTVREHLEATFRCYGLPEAMFVDNGSPWGDSNGQRWTRLVVWLLKLGIRMVHSRPYHPQSRGKNERLHRTLNAEVLELRRFHDLAAVQVAFDQCATSTISTGRIRRSSTRCLPAAIISAPDRCRTGWPARNTPRARWCVRSAAPGPSSASRDASGLSGRHSSANTWPSARVAPMAITASSSALIRSPSST